MEKFDYIIGGAGCSGLTLAYLLNNSSLNSKKILLLDVKKKSRNDRTFCFWEKDENIYEKIVYKKWGTLEVKSNNINIPYDLKNYTYKMIRGIDLYKYVKNEISKNTNFQFKNEKILAYRRQNNSVLVTTNSGEYKTEYYFNSIPQIIKDVKHTSYFHTTQHFLGWFIETADEVFDPDKATFMDFSVEQNYDLRFCYILPFSKNGALVEYTMFSKSILSAEEYQTGLSNYIENNLGITKFKIIHKEFGRIPMTNYPLSETVSKNIINIGIPGGMIKPSCGFGFIRMQNQLKNIVEKIENNKNSYNNSIRNKRHNIYNSTFLNVINDNSIEKKGVFLKMFSNNHISDVFKFLDEKTNFIEEFRFFMSVHKRIFLKAFLNEMYKSFKKLLFKIFSLNPILMG
ncbi:lycopene cyclase family protein [Bacteroidota bacterium]